ncbi:unnamed protein product [Knipowitschia caucasica]
MCTTVDSVEVIVLSDEEEPEEGEASVLLVEVEPVNKNDRILSSSALEEDLVVTFSRSADVLPHARYDCPIQPFVPSECEISAPVHANQLFCEQCFCYICDQLASQCKVWSSSGMCHCNSHKRSTFWNNQRNSRLLGGLQAFNLSLCEIDSHLRQAELLLQKFKSELLLKFSAYLFGKPGVEYNLKILDPVHDYSPVYECVSSFLDLAERQDSRAGAIMQLGALETFVRHCPLSRCVPLPTPMSNAAEAITVLANRVISWLQRQMVMGEFTNDFIDKLQFFYLRVPLPTEQRSLRNSLCVRPWDDLLLGTVLRGQNVTGYRNFKGKRDVLVEPIFVVQLRVERLQQQGRYRELCRYLRVVQSDEPKILDQVLDLMPIFLCADGQLVSSLQNLLTYPRACLTPPLFMAYMHMFQTATAPVNILRTPADLCSRSTAWKPIQGAVRLQSLDLVKFALKAQATSSDILNESLCWVSVLSVVTSAPGFTAGFPEPSAQYLRDAKELVQSLVALSKTSRNFHIPRHFQTVYPHQALLLLVTEALSQRILLGPLRPLLPVLLTYQNNTWALQWLWNSLSSSVRLDSIMVELTQEMEQSTDKTLGFLYTLVPASKHNNLYVFMHALSWP